jgi:hypothetical protein
VHRDQAHRAPRPQLADREHIKPDSGKGFN